jgi:hypothetical protein
MQVAIHKDKHPLYLNEKEHFGTGQHYVILVFFIYLFIFGVKYPQNRENRKKNGYVTFLLFSPSLPQNNNNSKKFYYKKTLLVRGLTKIRAHKASVGLILVVPSTKGSLPDIKICQKFSGETKAKQEGGGIMKNFWLACLLASFLPSPWGNQDWGKF